MKKGSAAKRNLIQVTELKYRVSFEVHAQSIKILLIFYNFSA